MFVILNSLAIGVLVRAEEAQNITQQQKPKSKVLIGTDRNFDTLKKQYPRMIVKMRASWCGHCKAFAPIYEEAAEKISDVAFVDINCEKNPDVCARHNVEGYPTVKYYHDGTLYTYRGERTVDGLEQYFATMRAPLFPETTSDQMEVDYDGKQYFVLYGNDASIVKYEPFLKRSKGDLIFGFVRSENERFVAVQDGVEVAYTGKLIQQNINNFLAMHRLKFYPELGEAFSRASSGRICVAVVEPEVEMTLEEQLREIQTGNQESERYKLLEKIPIVRGDTSQNEKFYELFAEPHAEQYVLMLHVQGRDYMYVKQEVHNAKDVFDACRKYQASNLFKAETPEDKEKRLKADQEAAAKTAEQDVENVKKQERIQQERSEATSIKINPVYIYVGASGVLLVIVLLLVCCKGDKRKEQTEVVYGSPRNGQKNPQKNIQKKNKKNQ